MFDAFRQKLLRALRVPPEPETPFGAPGSARVFRAAPNFYKLKLFIWALGQAATLFGIVVSLLFLAHVKKEADYVRSQRQAAAARAAASEAGAGEKSLGKSEPAENGKDAPAAEPRPRFKPRFREFFRIPTAFLHDPHNPLGRLIERSPWWLFPGIALLEFLGIAFYLLQLPITYALVRLEFESRWYIVTDRSLRIRWGLVTMREATMSFANIQQVSVSQGPLQRLLGLADVHVKSAGGGSGGSEEHHGGEGDSMHQGAFQGVANAHEIRDLILDRLRRFREAGLGDPEDKHLPAVAASAPDAQNANRSRTNPDTLAAAQELLTEARALRRALN